VTPTNHRLKYLAWLLPAAALGLTLSASGREDVGQRGVPAVKATQSQTQAPSAPAQSAPGRSGPPPARPGSGWGEWWKDDLVIKELQLSPVKARTIDRIFSNRTGRMQHVAEQWEAESAKLEKMAEERVADESTFNTQVLQVSFYRSRLWESRQVMLYLMHKELTPEQQKKLREIQERNRGRGGRGSH
jgi:Spy/CpxP family protein refolding chaperone